MYSVRTAAEKDFLGTIRQVADMGYDGIQFAGFFDTPATEVKKVLNEKGLHVAGSHTDFDLLKGDKLKEAILYNQEINNDLIICPYVSEEKRRSRDDYKRLAEELNLVGQKCREDGVTFAYHNHQFEFDLYDGTTGLDLLFGNTDPDLVKMELDCFWANYAGYPATNVMETYSKRLISLHIKDMIEEDGRRRSTEIGFGAFNMKDLLQSAKNHQVEWLIVEQEDFEHDPMVSAKLNQDNLRAIVN